MNYYETLFILKQSLHDEEAARIAEKYKGFIEQHQGVILKLENWGRRKLAYDIQKEKKGIYFLIYFRMSPQAVDALERMFRLDESVIRHLIVKLSKQEILQRERARKTDEREAAVQAESGSGSGESLQEA